MMPEIGHQVMLLAIDQSEVPPHQYSKAVKNAA